MERRSGHVFIFDTAAEAYSAGAESFASRAERAGDDGRVFRVALSGGEEPRPMYELLAQEPYRSRIPWECVHIFFGDERCVPPDHERSNYRMAREALLDRVPLADDHVHRMPGELAPERGAAWYEEELEAHFGAELPRFDLLHLGIGEDAHTASLFPGHPALQERTRRVSVSHDEAQNEDRLTLTLPVLGAAHRVEFLVVEEGKADALGQVLEGRYEPHRHPAQAVRPLGERVWLVTRAAARRLQRAA